MGTPEFLVEFTKAYGIILSHLLWPLVVLAIFFSLLYYFDRSVGSLGRRKRVSLSWKDMNRFIVQLESRYVTKIGNENNSSNRLLIVRGQIQRAKKAIDQRDEQELVKSIFTLSSMGISDDADIPKPLPHETRQWLESSVEDSETVNTK
jgi:lipopolysaccharide export LptBFGC system permease protein LptF